MSKVSEIPRKTLKQTPGESSKEAFLRRLKKSDPAYDIYATYAEEHGERWAAAKALSMDEAVAQMPEIERKYKLECEENNRLFEKETHKKLLGLMLLRSQIKDMIVCFWSRRYSYAFNQNVAAEKHVP